MSVDEHPFELSATEGDDSVTFEVVGEVDVAHAMEVEERLLAAVHRGVAVTVHAGDVTFIDSSGLRALVTARQEAVAQETAFTLGRRSAVVQRLLRVTGLDEIFGSE